MPCMWHNTILVEFNYLQFFIVHILAVSGACDYIFLRFASLSQIVPSVNTIYSLSSDFQLRAVNTCR